MKLNILCMLLLLNFFSGTDNVNLIDSDKLNMSYLFIGTTPFPDDDQRNTFQAKPSDFIVAPVVVEESIIYLSDETQTNRTTVSVKRLCGYPVNYDMKKCHQLNITSQALLNCEYKNGSAIFGSVVCSLALMIFLGNAFVILVIFKKKGMKTKYNFIKASLAVADLLCGLILLASILPNIIYVRNSTEKELVDDISDTKSPSNIFFGALLTMSFQSSLLHLMFLSIYRFIAMKWPLKHRQQKLSTLLISLGLLWVISMLCSFIPAAFGDIFEFTFQPVLYFSFLTMKTAVGNEARYQGPLYLAIIYGLPFIITVVVSIYTGLILRQKLKVRALKFGGKDCSTETNQQTTTSGSQAHDKTKSNQTDKTKLNSSLKPEVSIFLTLLTMIAVFTIAIIPGIVVQILFFSKTLDCFNYSIPYTISFYIAMSNGFANVLIYSFRDVRFRKAVREIFKRKRSKQQHISVVSVKTSRLQET